MAATADRRQFLRQTGLGLIAAGLGGAGPFLSPAAARASGSYEFRVLSAPERATLAALGDTLLPGAVQEGFCEFIDYHLSLPAADCLLMLRYLDVPPPYAMFYRSGLEALDRYVVQAHGRRFDSLDGETRAGVVSTISRAPVAGWSGPPSPLFYFALRSDAVDVYYGTEEGFERLDVPYMAHIPPVEPW